MPLTQEQEELKHRLRVDLMTINIEKFRTDMAAQQRQLELEKEKLGWETKKFAVQMIVAFAAVAAAASTVTTLILSHH